MWKGTSGESDEPNRARRSPKCKKEREMKHIHDDRLTSATIYSSFATNLSRDQISLPSLAPRKNRIPELFSARSLRLVQRMIYERH